VIDPTKPLRIVLTGEGHRDPALDMTWQEIEKYRASRDPDDIKLHPGKTPTWFHCQRVGKLIVANMIDAIEFGGLPARKLRAFKFGCSAVDLSPDIAARAGKETLTPDPTKFIEWAEGVREAGHEWFEAVSDEFPIEALYEVGDVIRQFSSMPRKHILPFVYRAG
jgi:hypothetical protein